MPRSASSNRELIELELASCIQKLAYLRGGGMTPRSFPPEEYAVIEAFGLGCCRRMSDELHARANSGTYAFNADGDYEPNPLDEDTQPGWKSAQRK